MIKKEPVTLYPRYISEDYKDIIDYTLKIELDKTNYYYWGARGTVYYELNLFDEAILDLTQAIELKPDYAMGFFNRGRCYYELEDFEQAIIEFEKSKSIDKSLVVNDYHLGLCCGRLTDYNKAIACYSSYLKENSKDKNVLKLRTELYYLTNQKEESDRGIAELLTIDIDSIAEIEKLNEARKSDTLNNYTIQKPVEFSDIGFAKLQDEKCSGVYILEFSNDEYYIGQAKKIQTGIKEHYKKYSDIRAVYFKPVHKDSLLLEESKTIKIFETNSLRILNLKQIKFVNIFDEASQQRWINELHYNKITGQKLDNTVVRNSFRSKFSIFKEKPYYEELIQLLATYIESAIPNYLASEYNYWTITCVPNHRKRIGDVSVVYINAVPVLSVYYIGKGKTLSFVINASKLPYLRYFKQNGFESLVSQISAFNLFLGDSYTEITEGDEVKLILNIEEFKAALISPLVLSSMRLFNLRMMNNVGKEIKHIRKPTHCLDLADAIINLLDS